MTTPARTQVSTPNVKSGDSPVDDEPTMVDRSTAEIEGARTMARPTTHTRLRPKALDVPPRLLVPNLPNEAPASDTPRSDSEPPTVANPVARPIAAIRLIAAPRASMPRPPRPAVRISPPTPQFVGSETTVIMDVPRRAPAAPAPPQPIVHPSLVHGQAPIDYPLFNEAVPNAPAAIARNGFKGIVEPVAGATAIEWVVGLTAVAVSLLCVCLAVIYFMP